MAYFQFREAGVRCLLDLHDKFIYLLRFQSQKYYRKAFISYGRSSFMQTSFTSISSVHPRNQLATTSQFHVAYEAFEQKMLLIYSDFMRKVNYFC